MKHLLAIAAVACIFTACKKENISNTAADRKLVKAESTTTSDIKNFIYNSQGRLSEMKSTIWHNKYSYPATGPSYEIFNASNVKQYVVESKGMNNGRVTNLDYNYYINGVFNFNEPQTFQYNTDGYLTGYTYGGYMYAYEVNGGNYTKYTVSLNGTLQRQYIVEYYTDMPDKTNLNFFGRFINMYLSDKAEFGKGNKNLIKKVTRISTPASSNDYIDNFTYTIDADGYVTSYSATEIEANGSSFTWGEKFYYQ